MRKAKIVIMSAIIVIMLCSCSLSGNNSKVVSETISSSSAISSEAQETKSSSVVSQPDSSVQTPSGQTSSKSESAAAQTDKTDYTAVAKQLLNVLNDVDKMGAGGLANDESQTVKNGSYEYAKVTDSRFANTDAVNKYLKEHMTEKMISSRYSGIVGTDSPRLIDNNGQLYQRIGAMGGGFTFSDENPEISDTTATGFTIKAIYDDYGAQVTMTVNVVYESNQWKIDSVNMG